MTDPSSRQSRLFKFPTPPVADTSSDGRPTLAIALLAVVTVLSLGLAGTLLSDTQQISWLGAQADTKRGAHAQDAKTAREELARERSARQAAERAAESLRAELAMERQRGVAAVRTAQRDAQRLREALEAARTAAVDADLALTLERTSSKVALQMAAVDSEAQVTQERQAVEHAARDLTVAMEFLAQERQAKDEAVRALREVRLELAKALNLKSDGMQRGRRLSPGEQAQVQRWAALSVGALDSAPPQATGATASSAQASSKDPGWTTYRDAQFDFTIRYPAGVFLPGSDADQERAFVSQDGKARLTVHGARNGTRQSLQAYRRAMLGGAYRGAKLDYAPVRKTWFVLSGTKGDEMFYDRITFACGGQAIHGWRLVYPLAERARYKTIVEQMHKGYRFDGRSGGCGSNGAGATRTATRER